MISVIGRQKGNTIEPFDSESEDLSIFRMALGEDKSLDEMIQDE